MRMIDGDLTGSITGLTVLLGARRVTGRPNKGRKIWAIDRRSCRCSEKQKDICPDKRSVSASA